MVIAAFSDIRGNIHALDAVLADIVGRAPDRVVCLGDLLEYGALPNEFAAALRTVK